MYHYKKAYIESTVTVRTKIYIEISVEVGSMQLLQNVSYDVDKIVTKIRSWRRLGFRIRKLLFRYVYFTFVNLALASKPLSSYILVQMRTKYVGPTLYQPSLIVYVLEFIVKMFKINTNSGQ